MASGGRRGKPSQLRIIGGQWRGRRLSFSPAAGLRPTPDRVRETLFNWLAPVIRGARCADLYAGSGALGLEALSRGAAHCDFVDRSSSACKGISEHLLTLGANDRGSVAIMEATNFLMETERCYDLVFIDPPFATGLVEPTCRLLDQRKLLCESALVYIETGVREQPNIPATDWQLHREKTAGDVTSRLYLLEN